ncbi:MAG: hypothetical protein V4487_02600 [Chlamydiota bacterium]
MIKPINPAGQNPQAIPKSKRNDPPRELFETIDQVGSLAGIISETASNPFPVGLSELGHRVNRKSKETKGVAKLRKGIFESPAMKVMGKTLRGHNAHKKHST